MNTVGLKLLKENLGVYVARARDGEHIIVTDRGTEVAELVPLSPERRVLLDLVDAGDAEWSGGKPQLAPGAPNLGQPVSDAVIEGRS